MLSHNRQEKPCASSSTVRNDIILSENDIIAIPKDSSALRRIYFKNVWDALTEAQNVNGPEKRKVIRTMRLSNMSKSNKREQLEKKEDKMTKACRKVILGDQIRHRKIRRKKLKINTIAYPIFTTTTIDGPKRRRRNHSKRRRKKKTRPVIAAKAPF